MPQASIGRSRVRFAVFELDLESGELRKYGVKIKLQQKPFQILTLLLERPGEIVTREELQRRLLPSDVFVDFESGLNNAVKKLRAALGDSAETPRFVETVARHGYRFLVTPQLADRTSTLPAPPDRPPRISRMRMAAVLVVLMALLGSIWAARRRTAYPASVASEIHKIAVLPLENLSHDDEQEYFADGMTDAIIDQLARVRGLTVISRTSTMLYKKARKPLPQIARELGVDTVVEGTVLRAGNRVSSLSSIDRCRNGPAPPAPNVRKRSARCFAIATGCSQRRGSADHEQLDGPGCRAAIASGACGSGSLSSVHAGTVLLV